MLNSQHQRKVLLPLDRRIARFRVVSGAGELGFLLLFHREPCSHPVVSTDYMRCSQLRRVFSSDRRVIALTCGNAVRLCATDYMGERVPTGWAAPRPESNKSRAKSVGDDLGEIYSKEKEVTT